MRYLLSIIVILILSMAPSFADPIVVGDDPGGSLSDNIKWLNRIEAAKIPVEVNGTCVSACTIVLNIDNVCVSRWSKFGFHLPYDIKTGKSERAFDLELAKNIYPKPLADWYIKNVIGAMDKEVAEHKDDPTWQPENKVYWLTAQELVAMGVTKLCT